MALVVKGAGGPIHTVRPLPIAGAALLGTLAFVVAVAVVSRATADGSQAPRLVGAPLLAELPLPAPAPSPPVALVDAGSGLDDVPPIVTVLGEDEMRVREAVPAALVTVAPPPVDAMAVLSQCVPILTACLREALRFDPSLGGTGPVTLTLRVGQPARLSPGLVSAVLDRCVAAQLPTAALPNTVDVVVTGRARFDGLRGTVTVDGATIQGVGPNVEGPGTDNPDAER